MTARCQCPDCPRTFVDENALWQHRKFRHRMGVRKGNAKPQRDDDFSLAEIAIDAQRKQMAGEPVEDWGRVFLA